MPQFGEIEFLDLADQPIEQFHSGFIVERNKNGKPNKFSERFSQIVKYISIEAFNPSRIHKQTGMHDGFCLWSDEIRGKEGFYSGHREADKFKKMVIDKKLFTFTQHDISDWQQGNARSWMMTGKTRKAFEQFFIHFNIHPNKQRKPNHNEVAIDSNNSDYKPRNSTIQLPRWIPVNTKSLKEIASDTIQSRNLSQYGLQKIDRWILQIAYAKSVMNSGFLPQRYVESPYGRLYGRNGTECIQIIPNRLLKYFLHKAWDYDICACGVTILSQMAKKIDSNLKTDLMDDYVINRKTIRESISKKLGVKIERIKTSITAITYGAGEKSVPYWNKGELIYPSIRRTLGSESITKQFFSLSEISGLIKEVKACRKILLNNLSVQFPTSAKSESKKIAYLIQTKEREILESMVRHLHQASIQIYAIKHDGIIIDRKVNEKNLTDGVFKETGFIIRLDKESIHK